MSSKPRPEHPFAEYSTKALHAHLDELAHALTVVLIDSTARERGIDNAWIRWTAAEIRAEIDRRPVNSRTQTRPASTLPSPLSTVSTP